MVAIDVRSAPNKLSVPSFSCAGPTSISESVAFWPATVLWEALSSQEARISPTAALELINSIPDPEILLQSKVTLANAWLGRPKGFAEMRTKKKSEGSAMMFPLPTPSGTHTDKMMLRMP